MPSTAFVDFLQNHDQIGNRAFGERLIALAEADLVRELTAILLLSPHIPLLFMGEEWGETRPFAFFTDFHGELADTVREGRRREFAQFAAFRDPARRTAIPDPNAPDTFEASKVDWQCRESEDGRSSLSFYRNLLRIRRAEIVPRLGGAPAHCGRIVNADDGLIAVDWRLDGATLRLRANLSKNESSLPSVGGRMLYATSGASDETTLPRYSAVIRLDETGQAET